ncbi:hypothetical protein [Roseimicrobium gellanilyticum]|nr:hypothetical protein [Roseimicrobium gellanilyticum]
MKTLTVNDALGTKDQIHGHCIEVEGLLGYDSEIAPPELYLAHWPRAERIAGEAIKIVTEGAFSFNEEVLKRWSGKRVVVLGVFETMPPGEFKDWLWFGLGHSSHWPARIVTRRVDLLKKRLAEHDG